jgi:hypothetical protein
MSNNNAVGKALYLEFRQMSNTVQMLVTPEGYSLTGRYVPSTMYRRRISKSSPRTTWKQLVCANTSTRTPESTFVALSLSDATSHAESRMDFTKSLMTQLVASGYTLYKQPIVVEVASSDLDDVRLSKTPYKILGRVTRSRRKLEFGESLFNE